MLHQVDDTGKLRLILIHHDELPFPQTDPFAHNEPDECSKRHNADSAELKHESQNDNPGRAECISRVDDR